MASKTSPYRNQKVAILGVSTEGQDSAKFFAREGSYVYCLDRRSPQKLGILYEQLTRLKVSFQLGKNYLKGLDQFDLLVRTPGMSLTLPELIEARKRGQTITSLTKIFFAQCPGRIIGITGTKGKGTTSTLIYEMLKASGKEVYLGGNVGIPLLSKVRHMQSSSWVVLELSSFQLEDVTQSPSIAVVLRTTQEHLANFDPLATNYHQTKTAYVEAKKSIVRYQQNTDSAILNADDPTSCSFAQKTPARVYYFSRTDTKAHAYVNKNKVWLKTKTDLYEICDATKIKLKGIHNLENIAAASLAALQAGVRIEAMQQVVKIFAGLEHRLELVTTIRGVSYYDDSFSTTPETAIAALQSFTEPIILIVGGSEKGSDFTDLGKEIVKSSVKALILIGQMTERIYKAVEAALTVSPRSLRIITGLHSMEEIVKNAVGIADKGDVVILSPACASFDMFANYKERGSLFKHYVKKNTAQKII